MVSTEDSESSNPGSNPGRPTLIFFCLPLVITRSCIIMFVLKATALVAQWIAHWTSNPEVAGSSPVQGERQEIIRDGVVGNISACHADARGSIPRRGEKFNTQTLWPSG